MLYIICIQKDKNGKITGYRSFETSSESTLEITPDLLKDIIINNMIQVVNASIQNNDIVLKDWANGIATEEKTSTINKINLSGPKYVILAKENNSYKVIDHKGKLIFMCYAELRGIIYSKAIANCSITQIDGNKKIKTEDVYTIQKDKEFEAIIAEKYNNFIAKTIILGYKDTSFEYEVKNKEVRLTHYIGLNRNMIVPPFITAIGKQAFRDRVIETIKFSEELKIIGTEAFNTYRKDSIEHVEIPSTISLIGNNAFKGHIKLSNLGGGIRTKYFKILGDKTVVLDQGL